MFKIFHFSVFSKISEPFLEKLNGITVIFLSFFFILFISKFSRIAEYGSDIAGQIIIAIYFFYIIEIFFNKKLSNKDLINYSNLSLILIIFAITLKFILVIYSILFFFVLFIIFKKKIFFDTLKPFLLFFINETNAVFLKLITGTPHDIDSIALRQKVSSKPRHIDAIEFL